MKMLNDYELLYYCYQNNEASFNLLLEKYTGYIYYVINVFKQNYYFFCYEEIDLYSEATILLYECIYNYREELNTKFSTYFVSCLKRHYLNIVRSLTNNKNRTHAVALSLDGIANNNDMNLYSIIAGENISVSEQVNNNDYLKDGLTKLQKQLNVIENRIVYYYLKGYSYREIAIINKVSLKKIDNTLQKYRRIIKM